MPQLAKLRFPPGVVKPGTVYDAKGRWYDTSLVRWHDRVMQPVGGWSALTGAGSTAVGGPVRAMRAWRRLNGTAYVAFGTHNKLYVYSAGTLSDITPASGYTAGAVDASGTYYSRVEAATWQFDTFGEDLVACALSDGDIFLWDASAGVGTKAAWITGSPTQCVGVVTTPERFVVALGANGDRRSVAWSDQEDATEWTPAVDNQAGSIPLDGDGQIMCGRRGRGETLIWTDVDLFAMRYIGGQLVYSFQRLGTACGPISRNSMAMLDGRAIWMGSRNFWAYDGFVKQVPSEVSDYVFNDLNRAQASKVYADVRSEFSEIWWYYPASASSENNRAVVFCYADGQEHWRIETIARTSGIDRGFLEYPLFADPDGCVYEAEKGTTYADEGGSPSYTPYATSGPIEIGDGDTMMNITNFIPDEESLGEANVSLLTRLYPTGTETTNGPYTLANPTSVRLTARQVRLTVTQVTGGWRWGTPRIEISPGSRR